MFGNNKIHPLVTDPTHLAVESTFYTLQGEGPFTGCPALFIRLAGCNLACHFCDTQFESQVNNLQVVDDIVIDLQKNYTNQQRRFVVLTGGEPLRQNVVHFLKQLLATGTELIQIETAGTVWQVGLEDLVQSGKVVIVCSPKTPSVNLFVKEFCHHWKYIITAGEISGDDGLPNRGTQVATKDKGQKLFRIEAREWGWKARPDDVIWVSPCDSYNLRQNQANQAAAVNSALKFGYRLNLQIHKIVGLE